FQLYSYLTGGARRQKAKALAAGEDPDGDAAMLDVLAAIEKFPGLRPDPEACIEALDPLQPRLYSIASSPKTHPGRVALTVDTVRYRVGKRERLGVASTFLSARIRSNAPIKCYVQDRMREVGRDLWSWLADGAHVYVCGDAQRMAKDVERALVDIVAQHGARTPDQAIAFVAELKKQGRYQQDVY